MHKDIDITAIREKTGWFLYEMPGLIHEMVKLGQLWPLHFEVAATAGINFNLRKILINIQLQEQHKKIGVDSGTFGSTQNPHLFFLNIS